jgi:hypothetical protein
MHHVNQSWSTPSIRFNYMQKHLEYTTSNTWKSPFVNTFWDISHTIESSWVFKVISNVLGDIPNVKRQLCLSWKQNVRTKLREHQHTWNPGQSYDLKSKEPKRIQQNNHEDTVCHGTFAARGWQNICQLRPEYFTISESSAPIHQVCWPTLPDSALILHDLTISHSCSHPHKVEATENL